MVEILYVFLASIVFIFLVKKFARSLKLLDIPNDRSSHAVPKPRGAGIGIFLAVVTAFFIFRQDFFIENIYFFIALSIVFLIGVWDDIMGVSPKVKFLFIILAIVLLFVKNNLGIFSLGNWFGVELKLPYFIAMIFTIFAVVGFTNALNLIDGLDGLAGGVSFVIFSTFFYFGIIYKDLFILNISLFMITAIVAFLFFNWHPAKIFLGDSGSLVLGFVISILSIELIKYVSITTVLFLGAIPLFDTILVMTRRIQNKKSPFYPDKTHIHHRFYKMVPKVDLVVMFIIMLQLAFVLMAMILQHEKNSVNLLLFTLFLMLVFRKFKKDIDEIY